jgi:hypothetical protein
MGRHLQTLRLVSNVSRANILILQMYWKKTMGARIAPLEHFVQRTPLSLTVNVEHVLKGSTKINLARLDASPAAHAQ